MQRARVFEDRAAAGVELAQALRQRHLKAPLRVLGLPRGGVPVASEVAQALHVPLDVMVVRKIGMPGQPELAIGAIAAGGIAYRDPRFEAEVGSDRFERLVAAQEIELARREQMYRSGRAPLDFRGRTVILVDDGLATGSTMLAAARAARHGDALAVIAAAPVASSEAATLLRTEADDTVFLQVLPQLTSVGEWYVNFDQTSDAEVLQLLAASIRPPARDAPG